jgi:uncharacterized damage-inducible protein DinB
MSASTTAIALREFPRTAEAQNHADELIRATEDVLSQGLRLLFELEDATYSRTADAPFHASIGGHYRHVLEHFESLIKGLRAREINYDARERNLRMQSEVTYASVVTCDMLRALRRCSAETLSRNCKVINSVGYGSSQPVSMDSNIGRELAYCIGHAIHHYAIIRLLCHELGVSVPAEFGVAPSTLKHRAAAAS